jgi:DNA mismatch repair protein MutS
MIASIDCVTSLSLVAQKNRYVKPTMTNGYELVLKDGRHPVVESFEQSFISNDTQFNPDERMIILTGPNMAGKSTFMRQVAIITLLAHIGSFVPTTSATIGIVDRIFTRVGAYDNLARGQSTFMVEMAETASILSHATTKSLLILDEIGSATSTYDGVAIAWAVALDIARRIGAKTIFSTHYHVLARLGLEKGVVNYKVSVLEKEGDIIFLHKVVRGGTDKSYGLHVAKLAGVPAAVLEQARKIQIQLEDEDKNKQQVVVEKRSNDPESVMYVKVKQRTLLDE